MAHHCNVHNTPYFKKGKMKGYAHPIEDTGEWCNEPEVNELDQQSEAIADGAERRSLQQSAEVMKKDDWAEKDRITRASIESQTAYKGIMDNLEGVPKGLKEAAFKWALWKLTNAQPPTSKQTTPLTGKSEGVTVNYSNLGEFLTAVKDTFGLFGVPLLDALGIESNAEIKNFNAAWIKLEEWAKKEEK